MHPYAQVCLECGHASHISLIIKLGSICPKCEADLEPVDIDQVNWMLQEDRELELEHEETDSRAD
jgi:predicted Zn-ribbon and HTH transcriptional regulator